MEIVHDVPGGAPIMNIEGKKGESLFCHPVIWFIQEDFKRIMAQSQYYKKLIEEAREERLLAIIGALSVEEALDSFLSSYIPDYKLILENTDFTLSMKIEIAYSLRLIPRHILNTANLIRAIRNEVAHNINIGRFDSLNDDKFKNKLRVKFQEFFPNDTNTELTVKDRFIHLVEGVIVALGIYATHLRSARDYIYSDGFGKELVKRIKEKDDKPTNPP